MTETAGIETTPDDAARAEAFQRYPDYWGQVAFEAGAAWQRAQIAARRDEAPHRPGFYHCDVHCGGPHDPETVTTAAELDALPVGSVVRYVEDPDDTGDRVAEKVDDFSRGTWVFVGSPAVFTSAQMAADGSPATVLHRGES